MESCRCWETCPALVYYSCVYSYGFDMPGNTGVWHFDGMGRKLDRCRCVPMHLCPYAMVFLCILSETSEITQTLLENLIIDGAWILGKTRGDVMNKIDLKQKFKALCDVYAAGTDALGFRCFAEKKETILELEFRRIRLQLVYRRKSSFPAPPSVLYCRVYPEKNNAIFLQLPQLLPLVRQRDFRACYFPYIENEARMEACFRQLTAITQELVPKLEALSASGGTEELLPRFLEQLGFRQEDAAAVLRPDSREQEILLGILKKMENNFIEQEMQC